MTLKLSNMATIREMIDQKIQLLRSVDSLGPAQIAQESIELSSLWASVRVNLVDREMSFNEKRRELVIEHGTAAKAKIFAEASEEYRALLEAKAYSDAAQEMMRTTKRAVALAEQEMRETPR